MFKCAAKLTKFELRQQEREKSESGNKVVVVLVTHG
jgi:hypothetical protein